MPKQALATSKVCALRPSAAPMWEAKHGSIKFSNSKLILVTEHEMTKSMSALLTPERAMACLAASTASSSEP